MRGKDGKTKKIQRVETRTVSERLIELVNEGKIGCTFTEGELILADHDTFPRPKVSGLMEALVAGGTVKRMGGNRYKVVRGTLEGLSVGLRTLIGMEAAHRSLVIRLCKVRRSPFTKADIEVAICHSDVLGKQAPSQVEPDELKLVISKLVEKEVLVRQHGGHYTIGDKYAAIQTSTPRPSAPPQALELESEPQAREEPVANPPTPDADETDESTEPLADQPPSSSDLPAEQPAEPPKRRKTVGVTMQSLRRFWPMFDKVGAEVPICLLLWHHARLGFQTRGAMLQAVGIMRDNGIFVSHKKGWVVINPDNVPECWRQWSKDAKQEQVVTTAPANTEPDEPPADVVVPPPPSEPAAPLTDDEPETADEPPAPTDGAKPKAKLDVLLAQLQRAEQDKDQLVASIAKTIFRDHMDGLTIGLQLAIIVALGNLVMDKTSES